MLKYTSMFLDILLETLLDSLKMLPFLLVAYFLIELIERKGSAKLEAVLVKSGRFGFIPGALLGLIPQCGFSGMAANLYGGNVITLGTLIAVFVSTSDEAVPLLIASKNNSSQLVKLLILKLLFALIAGFMVDLFSKKGTETHVGDVDCHDHKESESLFVATLRHTLHVFIFIFITTLVLNVAVALIGEERFASFIENAGIFQIFAAGLVGMIPNCASSVLLTQMYTAGQLSFPAMFAGLCTGAGIGPLVLFRVLNDKKRCITILALLYAIGIICGLAVNMLQ